MNYRIQYPPVRKLRGRERLRVRLPVLTVLSFFVFLLLVRILWPEGMRLLRSSVPVSALDHFALELVNGEGVMTSLSGFLRSFIHDSL